MMIDTTSAAARIAENWMRKLSSPVKLEGPGPPEASAKPLHLMKPEEEAQWEDV
jgi:hypothetical protein